MAPFAGGDAAAADHQPRRRRRRRASARTGGTWRSSPAAAGKKTQVWLLDRRGGEAVRLTDYQGRRLGPRLVAGRQAAGAGGRRTSTRDEPGRRGRRERRRGRGRRRRTDPPIVIRRLQFKRDGEGYLRDAAATTSTSSTWRRKTSVAGHLGPLRRQRAGLVAGRAVDRVRQQPHARIRTPTRTPTCSWWSRGRRRAPRALTTARRRRTRSPPSAPTGSSIAYVGGRRSRRTCGTARTTWPSCRSTGGAPRAAHRARSTATSPARASRPTAASVLFLLEDGGNSHLARVPVGRRGRRARGGRRARRPAVRPGSERRDRGPGERSPQRPAEVSRSARRRAARA